ncbi:MAG: site-2 protease family protein [Candidatus Nanohaloarchaea archaeon]|nr:site-2 protease family protein [Candidatus Nanohaloarchaea archaeon]
MLPGFLNMNIVAILLLVAGVAALLWRDREKIERHSILIVRRTEHGIEFLDRVAKRAPRLWKVWSTLGVIGSFVVMGFIVYFLFKNGLKVLMSAQAVPAVGLLLPTVGGQASMGPGYFLVPFWYWIVGISTVAIFHEMMHGVIARNEGFPIKSVGWFVLGILPGAFVEPEGEEMLPDASDDDEEEADDDKDEDADDDEDDDGPLRVEGPWGDGDWKSKLRVLAAGSAANLTIALLIFGVMLGMTTTAHGQREIKGLYEYNGAEIVSIYNNTAADRAGLKPGMVVASMDGHTVTDVRDFLRIGSNFSVNETVWMAGTYNGSRFNISAEIETRQVRNFTYRPAPIDPLLVALERRVPGTIENYAAYNDWVVGEDIRTELERWRWIRRNYEGMDQRASERIDALEAKLEDGPEPFLGVGIVSATSVKAGMAPLVPIAEVLLKLFFFMVMIHAGIGAANMMPIKPLDGGWMLSTVMERIRPAWQRPVVRFATLGTLFLFAVNIAVPLLF